MVPYFKQVLGLGVNYRNEGVSPCKSRCPTTLGKNSKDLAPLQPHGHSWKLLTVRICLDVGSVGCHSLCPPAVTLLGPFRHCGRQVWTEPIGASLDPGKSLLPRGKTTLSLSAELSLNSRALGFGGLTLVPCLPVLS